MFSVLELIILLYIKLVAIIIIMIHYLGSYAKTHIGSYTTTILDEVNCTGSEERLIDCGHAGIGVHQCSVYAGKASVYAIAVCAGI